MYDALLLCEETRAKSESCKVGADCAQWKAHSARWRSELNIPPTFQPWTSRPEFKGLGVPSNKRSLDLLDCSWVQACKKRNIGMGPAMTKTGIQQKLHEDLVVDISQSHARRPMSDQGVLRTLTTSSRLYHYGLDRMLLPREHLLMQGYAHTVCIPKSMKDDDVRSLAGEGIFLPCLGQILWCLHLTRNLTA